MEAGSMPFFSLPSLSPKSCFHHCSAQNRRGSKAVSISTWKPRR